MTYVSDESGDFVGTFSEYDGFYVQMQPPPDNVTLRIDDCDSYGEIDGENQFNGNERSSRSEIPF